MFDAQIPYQDAAIFYKTHLIKSLRKRLSGSSKYKAILVYPSLETFSFQDDSQPKHIESTELWCDIYGEDELEYAVLLIPIMENGSPPNWVNLHHLQDLAAYIYDNYDNKEIINNINKFIDKVYVKFVVIKENEMQYYSFAVYLENYSTDIKDDKGKEIYDMLTKYMVDDKLKVTTIHNMETSIDMILSSSFGTPFSEISSDSYFEYKYILEITGYEHINERRDEDNCIMRAHLKKISDILTDSTRNNLRPYKYVVNTYIKHILAINNIKIPFGLRKLLGWSLMFTSKDNEWIVDEDCIEKLTDKANYLMTGEHK